MAKSPRCQTSSSGPTVSFQRSTMASFIAATDGKGRRYRPKAPPWPKCVSLVKKIAIDATFCCAEPSGDGNVSLWKIVAFEQEGYVELIGARIGETIAHVERRGVPPSSVPFERRDSTAPDFSGDRHNPHCGLLKEAVEDRLCCADRDVAGPCNTGDGLVDRDW